MDVICQLNYIVKSSPNKVIRVLFSAINVFVSATKESIKSSNPLSPVGLYASKVTLDAASEMLVAVNAEITPVVIVSADV